MKNQQYFAKILLLFQLEPNLLITASTLSKRYSLFSKNFSYRFHFIKYLILKFQIPKFDKFKNSNNPTKKIPNPNVSWNLEFLILEFYRLNVVVININGF